jgi:cyclase
VLKIRVIPTLLWKDFGLVKGVSFDSWRRVGPVLPAIKVYNQREVDELILVDIVANMVDREPDYESIEDFVQDCFIPLTVGGGVTRIEQVQKLLSAGADKISINTGAYKNPDLITQVANRHGSQCVVASVDVRKTGSNRWDCYSKSGKETTKKDAIKWVKELENRGAGEILITSIDKDGTMEGYDFELISAVTQAVQIPVIASGGAGNSGHLIAAVKEAGASAVAAASIFHFTEQTPEQMKSDMREAGIPTRHIFR